MRPASAWLPGLLPARRGLRRTTATGVATWSGRSGLRDATRWGTTARRAALDRTTGRWLLPPTVGVRWTGRAAVVALRTAPAGCPVGLAARPVGPTTWLIVTVVVHNYKASQSATPARCGGWWSYAAGSSTGRVRRGVTPTPSSYVDS
ncbi:MAG TPA: hypothetical protein VHX38_32595 [Pseudonocardiaceae bacterium]|nr:hypothetical protein [Pseudonocardiaceae bacterium]